MMDIFQQVIDPFMNVELLFLVATGTLAGIIVGAIPGLSVTMALALILPLTYSWDLLSALAVMLGVYYGGVFGGSRASILVNIPGAPSSVATSFDGYPLSQLGEARLALTLTTIYSFIGGIIGVIVLAAATPLVSSIAIDFGQQDYFLLTMIGLLLISSLSKGSMVKGIFSACIGVILGLVGIDSLGAGPRFTFDTTILLNGIDFIVVILGLFGMSEVLYQIYILKDEKKKAVLTKIAAPSLRFILKFFPLSLRVSIMGVLIGALPGAGGEIASLLGYDHAKKTFKNPNRPFGEGAHAGVVAPEASNNAAIGGALIPVLTLGIPGDAVTAIFIGALFIHGLQPGPQLMQENGELFWFMVGSSFLSNIFLIIFGLLIVSIFVKIIDVPKQLLYPIIAVITVIGAYAINNSLGDVVWMIGFGIAGLAMRMNGVPVAPLILGMILGPLMETSFRRQYLITQGGGDFFLSFINSPISLVLTVFFIIMLVSQTQALKFIKNLST